MDIAFTIPSSLIFFIVAWLGIGVVWWAVRWFIFTNTPVEKRHAGWSAERPRRLLAIIVVWPFMLIILMWKAAVTLVHDENLFELHPVSDVPADVSEVEAKPATPRRSAASREAKS